MHFPVTDHDLFAVFLLLHSLLVLKFCFHSFLQDCNFLFFFKPHFFLKEILAVIELLLEFLLFFVKHLSESLFNQVSVIVKLLFSLLVSLCEAS